MKHGFIKVAVATPKVTVADCRANLSEMLRLHAEAEQAKVALLVYPELSVTGYTCGDLFFSNTLISAAERTCSEFLERTKNSPIISIIGLPLVVNDKIYNCGAICQKGQILGVVPKTFLPNHGEFYEGRHFASYTGKTVEIRCCGQTVPFGTRQLFACTSLPLFRFGVELCEDLWAPIPPSTELCRGGALVIANLAASGEAVGKDDYRRMLVCSQSARSICGYLLANCGDGESTTDLVFGGHALIAERGTLLAEKKPFSEEGLLVTELDLERLEQARRRSTTLSPTPDPELHTTYFDMAVTDTVLTRLIDPHPFIPADPAERAARCEAILTIQAKGLAQRIVKAYAKKCVIGISGGLDSCLAMLVAVRAMDLLGRSHTDVLGVTMPCFGTTERTKSNAELLCAELGAELRCVAIGASVKQHFSDIGQEESNRNVVYENAQARERTQVLMDIANMEGGIVVGTGDLSELALGWATYNGDHMSMYGVNADVPKTLIRHMVLHCADMAKAEKPTLARVLRDIVDTPVSPELLPADAGGNIAQKTEDLVGPYELHDFYIYHTLRHGYTPEKLYRMARLAFAGAYDDATLLKWLNNFLRRFFAQQFKRSCLPDGPKVGSVGLSPRGDWRMPSDASAAEWLRCTEEKETK
ncbi:MAG: NAD(+) synthase [Ruminococcaceae bacterium]|nr:NAD(+) synthase [Oscillospiraceae bacterium]